MPFATVRLLDKIALSDTVMAFHFEKPDGFDYRAGQYADYTLLDPAETDAEGDTREFTLSSAPFEDHLACTVRLRATAFKRVLASLPIGAGVEVDAAYGSFVLPRRDLRPAVLLTGGIGVTPARSMLVQADHDGAERDITLLYSARMPDDAPYLGELVDLAARNPRLHVVPTMTDPGAAAAGWTGRTGRIDAALLAESVPDLAAPLYYLCGPAGMVRGMRGVLAEAGVNDDDIRTEEFLGY